MSWKLGFCLKFEGFFPGIFDFKTNRGVSYKSIGVYLQVLLQKVQSLLEILHKKVLHIESRICVLDILSINLTIDKGLFSSESFR